MNHRKSYRLPRLSVLAKMGLKKELLEPWGLAIEKIDQIGNREWRLWSQRGEKILRCSDWTEDRGRFICSILDHLGRNGFRGIPRLISTVDGNRWLTADSGLYYLCDYFERREIDLREQNQLPVIFREMSRMHSLLESLPKTESVNPHPPVMSWNDDWTEQQKTLQRLRGIAGSADEPSQFESVFIDNYDLIQNQADHAIGLLVEAGYAKIKAEDSEIVCHGCFKEQNLFFTRSDELYIDHFDGCRYNLYTYDLGRFLYRVMSSCGWDMGTGELCLRAYHEHKPLGKTGRNMLAAFLCFPHPSTAIVRTYFEQRGGPPADELTDGIRRESMQLKRKESFLNRLLDQEI